MKTPIRYAGGKSKAYNIITEQIPKLPLPERIISPFMGGGSLESRWSSELGIEVIGYDIFEALTNFWNVLLTDSVGLADVLSELAPTKEKYKEIKEIFYLEIRGSVGKIGYMNHGVRSPALYSFLQENLTYDVVSK